MKTRSFLFLAVLLLLVAGTTVAVIEGRNIAHNVAEEANSDNSLYQIRSAFAKYISKKKRLPAPIAVETGFPHSWRTELDQTVYGPMFARNYGRIKFSEPWSSSANIAAASHPMISFHYARVGETVSDVPATDFFVVTGEQTAFRGQQGLRLSQIKDGLENTVLVMEVEGSRVPWTCPKDISFAELRTIYDGEGEFSINVSHPNGLGLLFADLAQLRMKRRLPFEIFQSLFTVAGSEKWNRSQLIEEGYLLPSGRGPLLDLPQQQQESVTDLFDVLPTFLMSQFWPNCDGRDFWFS